MKFEIQIGCAAICGIPVSEAIITFITGNYFTKMKLDDFKKIINDVCDSKGNRSDKAHEAKRELDSLFHSIINNIEKELNEQKNCIK